MATIFRVFEFQLQLIYMHIGPFWVLYSIWSSVRSSRFGFDEPEHVWWRHHVQSARKRRENVVFTQLGRGGDVVDMSRGCGGLQPNILVRMKVFSLYFHYCEHWPDCQMVPNMNTGEKSTTQKSVGQSDP